jgi:tetratricopeptide (TPR) repeat protein
MTNRRVPKRMAHGAASLRWRALFAVAAATVFATENRARAQESRIDPLRAEARAAGASPEAWRASLALGRALRRAGHAADAQAELRRALGLAGQAGDRPAAVADVDFELARTYFDRSDVAGAIAVCTKLAKVKGEAASGHACAAGAELVRQRASLALAETSEALALDPRSYEAKLAEGRAHAIALELGPAEASLRDAIALRPDDAEGHFALARVLSSEAKKEDALRELRRGVALDADDPDGLFDLAQAVGPGPERASLLERATRERPSFVDAWVALAGQRLSEGAIEPARAANDAALRAAPTRVDARILAGRIALAEGHADDAIRAGQDALKSSGNSAAAKLLVADGNAKKGEIDAAIEAYQDAWGLDHADPAPLVRASDACRAAGRSTTAVAFGERATQEFPDWAPAWAALGDARVARGERSAARDAYARALSAGSGAVDRDVVAKKLAATR